MALSYLNTTLRNNMVEVISDALNSGKIVFKAADGTVLATCTFAADAFGVAVSGVITANAIQDESSAVAGVLSKVEFQDSTGQVLIEGTAGNTVDDDVFFSKPDLAAGDIVSIASMTYTAPSVPSA